MTLLHDISTGSRALLRWLPGETLFSLVSRHHVLWGHQTAATTTRLLFEHPRAGSQHDFPSRLSRFADNTGGAFGDAADLARNRTLLRFYGPFLPETLVSHACTVMTGDDVSHLKLRIGVLTSRFRAHHPLKACTACMEADVRAYGWSYWRFDHQFPGVWTCPRHPDRLLRVAMVKVNGVERFQWHLPRPTILDAPRDAVTCRTREKLAGLADFIVSLLVGEASLADGWLRSAALIAFEDRGWITDHGHLRLKTAARDFLDYASGLRRIDELRGLPNDVEQAEEQLGRLLRRPRTGTHPLRYVVLAHWLYGDAAKLRSQIESPRERMNAGASRCRRETAYPEADRRQRALEALHGGSSARQVAHRVGVDTKTVLGWASLDGFAIARRPKVLTEARRQALVSRLERGCEKSDAARAAGVSGSTVNVVLFSEPGLHDAWRTTRHERRRREARLAWRRATKETQGAGVRAARYVAPAAYQWLYRHDPEWLKQHLPQRPVPVAKGRTSTALWTQRDREWSSAVDQADQAASSESARPLRRWQLCQAVPDLAPKLRRLDVLPCTKAAIERRLARARER